MTPLGMAPTSREEALSDPAHVLWASRQQVSSGQDLVVFLHGFGGRETDWEPAFAMLPDGVAGASLRGPLDVEGGCAWADFGPHHYQTSRGQAAISAAASPVLDWLDGLNADRVSLVGWSQGGAVAAQLLRQRPQRFVSVATVGGFVWDRRPHADLARSRLPFWYGMGETDTVIPQGLAEVSKSWLRAHTDAHVVQLAGEGHMLTPAFTHQAMTFTAGIIGAPRPDSA